LSDLFHENLSIDDIEKVWRSMCAALYRGHIFQILTKQAKRMATVVPVVMNRIYGFNWRMPDGIWLGVSAENQEMANERIPWLLRTPAAVRFVSYEPALGPVDFTRIEYEPGGSGGTVFIDALWGTFSSVGGGGELGKLSWLIAGGESGKGARPAHPDWFRRSRDQCAAAGVPYFFKQWGSWLPIATQRLNAKLGSTLLISPDGHTGPATWSDVMATAGNVWAVQKVGKRKAGRLLDGVEHSEFPGIPNQPASS
jgi:protein gp37